MTREQIQFIEAENVSYRKIFDQLNRLVEDCENSKYRNGALILDVLKGHQDHWETLRAKYDLLLGREKTRSAPRPSRS
jgi:hypothetical protein